SGHGGHSWTYRPLVCREHGYCIWQIASTTQRLSESGQECRETGWPTWIKGRARRAARVCWQRYGAGLYATL
ncbi:hypothetical protein BD414DRAFT_485589, partial [Trametes punicea]